MRKFRLGLGRPVPAQQEVIYLFIIIFFSKKNILTKEVKIENNNNNNKRNFLDWPDKLYVLQVLFDDALP